MAFTDQQLLAELQRLMLEPTVDGGLTWTSTLWTLTEAFPRYPARKPVSYDALLPFSESLRDWYFRTGGILLSVHARDAYFAVQGELRLHIDKRRTDRLEDEVYDAIRDRCSDLRTELTDDLLSRLAAPEVTRTGAA